MNTSYAHTHAEIIEACKLGDRQAQFLLYQLYSKTMYNICSRMLGNRSLAEDALQEAFISAFSKLHTFEGRSTFGAWLKRIVINKCLSHLKKNPFRYSELNEEITESIPLEEQSDGRTYKEDIHAVEIHEAIKSLPEGCRVVFTLYLLEGYDHNEISEILNISVSTAKSQFHRAKKLLKSRLQQKDHVAKD